MNVMMAWLGSGVRMYLQLRLAQVWLLYTAAQESCLQLSLEAPPHHCKSSTQGDTCLAVVGCLLHLQAHQQYKA